MRDLEALVHARCGLPQSRSIGDGDLGGGGQRPHLSVPAALRPAWRSLRLANGHLKEARLVGIHAYDPMPATPLRTVDPVPRAATETSTVHEAAASLPDVDRAGC